MCVCICTCTNICKYIFVCVYVFLCLCMYYIIVMYVCVHVRKWIYMYVFMYICVSLCVCLSLFHEKIPSASSFTFWSSQFHSQSHSLYFHAYLVIQRRQMKCGSTQKLPWDGDYQIDSRILSVFFDSINCKARYRQG